ncbi:MAG: CHAT domain-containing protein, partial [Bacteroidota bacterium]|nr:CHAT domain-containing protein [Bacteroidota bacterium]
GDIYGQAFVLGGMGYIYYFYDTEITLQYYQEALKAREKLDDKQLMSASLNGIGLVYARFLNEYERAIEYYDKAAIIRKEIKDWKRLGTTLTYKASAYEKAGQPELARETFIKSFEVHKKLGDKFRMGEAMLNSGTILGQLGKFNEALSDFATSMEIFRELNDTIGIGDVLTQMSTVYVNLGDYPSAISACSESLNLMKAIKDDLGIAGAFNNMGLIYQSAGRLGKSTEYYRYALEKFEELKNHQNVIIVLNNIGTVYFDQGEYSKAEEYHFQGLERSREINSRMLQGYCIINLANDQNQLQKLEEAWSNYESALELAQSLNSPELEWKAMVGMAENYKLREEYDKAIAYNEKALAIIEEMRSSMQSDEFKANYMARERYVFEDVINMLGELHEKDPKGDYDSKAFQLAEQSKSRALLDLLTESIANVQEGADPKLLIEQNEILTSLNRAKQDLGAESAYNDANVQLMSSLKEEIKAKESELNDLKIRIRSTNPKYGELKYPEPVSMEQLQSTLDKKTVILEYSLGDSSSWLWVIGREKHNLIKLPDRNTLQEQVELLRFALQDPKQGNIDLFAEVAHRLYQKIIQPADIYIPKKCNLIVIPDGILNYLPYEVLLTDVKQNSTGQLYSDLSYLVLKHPINYAQSASVLKNLVTPQSSEMEPGSPGRGLIAFGDPVYENEADSTFLLRKGLGRLEYSGEEVEKIASFFPKDDAKTYLREQATEGNVKATNQLKGFQYLHFATHGLMDEKQPDFSSLVLTQDENSKEDGFLQAAEIFNLQMNADMVVLSACQTGLGKMIRGEGMVGLTRAFMYAGAPSVLVS